jgi:uncharacterized membrane protein
MQYIDRSQLKYQARTRLLDQSYNVLGISFIYLVLTDLLSDLVGIVWKNPLSAIAEQFYTSMDNVMEQVSNGTLTDSDVQPIYSATASYARNLLSQPVQRVLLFVFLLLFLYTIVMSFGFSHYAMGVARGERMKVHSLFDPFWMSGKILLMYLLTTAVSALGMTLFILPGLYFYYSVLFAPYVLLDQPDLSVFKAMKLSFQMSRGYKRQLLAMDISFIGWMLLGTLASEFGYSVGMMVTSNDVVGTVLSSLLYVAIMVYVLPYRELSFVNFYEKVRMPELKV